jgi:serine/threonine protein phosphatase 1
MRYRVTNERTRRAVLPTDQTGEVAVSTYVLSDVHGHVAALDAALSKVSMAQTDELYVLGDMVDRGPDPLGVIRLIRSLPNCHVLKGNHEDLMLTALADSKDEVAWLNWSMNGAATTAEGLESLPPETFESIVGWVRGLPLYEVVTAGERDYVLCHAGIRAPRPRLAADGGNAAWDPHALEDMMGKQDPEDLLWIREEFWGRPTGMVNANGSGPVVVAGHTPTPYVVPLADRVEKPYVDDEGHALMLNVGACDDTGYEPDRIATDCAAAAGAGLGQIGIICLETRKITYAPIAEGE